MSIHTCIEGFFKNRKIKNKDRIHKLIVDASLASCAVKPNYALYAIASSANYETLIFTLNSLQNNCLKSFLKNEDNAKKDFWIKTYFMCMLVKLVAGFKSGVLGWFWL